MKNADYFLNRIQDCPYCKTMKYMGIDSYWKMYRITCTKCGLSTTHNFQPFDRLSMEQSKSFSLNLFQEWNNLVAEILKEEPVRIIITDKEMTDDEIHDL